MNHSDGDRTVALLTSAMQRHVATVADDPEVAAQVRLRQWRRRDRIAVAGVTAAIVGVVSGAAAVASWPGDPGRDVAPLATTAPARGDDNLPVEVTYLPPRFSYASSESQDVRLPDDTMGEQDRVTYARASTVAGLKDSLIIEAIQGRSLQPVSRSDYEGERVEEVRLGARTVLLVYPLPGSSEMAFYVWDEAPGLSISVEGRGRTTDAEVRAFINGLRRRG